MSIANYNAWLVEQGTIATSDDANELYQAYRLERIAEITAKIPIGTICNEFNNCGGYLTTAEVNELEALL